MKSELTRRPQALTAASTVGVVSLASMADPAALEAGCRALRSISGQPCEVRQASMWLGDFAGTVEERVAALAELWQRDDVAAIVCARGGYGANYVLPGFAEILKTQKPPKAFVGYSDNTALLLALERAGIACFHGPMVASDFACGRADEQSFLAALRGEPLDFAFDAASAVRTLIPGEASGTITGGCLSLVAASLGTPWEVETEGKILFLEDVNEKIFRVDRMLRQLLLAGKFDGVQAVVFGEMLGCEAAGPEQETLPQMIQRILESRSVPIVYGFSSGHVSRKNLTLPFGVPTTLEASQSGVRLRVEASTAL